MADKPKSTSLQPSNSGNLIYIYIYIYIFLISVCFPTL